MRVNKEKMPPEHLRRTMNVLKSTCPASMGAMRYLPYALHNLLRSMPMPWEPLRYVSVLYHVSGVITFVTEKRRADAHEYRQMWSMASTRCSEESKKRGGIRVLSYPVFDDEQEIMSYGSIIGMPIPKGVECLEATESVFCEQGQRYLFNSKSFAVARKVGVWIEGGPHVSKKQQDVMIMGRTPGLERVAYPYVYNKHARLPCMERLHMKIECGLNAREALHCDLSTSLHGRVSEAHLSGSGGHAYSIRPGTKSRHPVDIPLMKGICFREGADGKPSVKAIMKGYAKCMERKPQSRKCPTNVLKGLRSTRYFQKTEIDWMEAGLQVLSQGHMMLSEILKRKKLSYLFLDWNFNLRPVRTLTTKERKRSRVGMSYHLLREMLKFVKHVVDLHVVFRQGLIDCYELAKNVEYVLCNAGILTGMYRYKYRIMRQIKRSKEMHDVAEYAGVCSWAEQWRTWCFMLRGHIPLLERCVCGLIRRIAEGREYRAKPLSKQRSESGYDVSLKRRIVGEVSCILHPEQIKKLLQHFGEAWRCWKASVPYHLVHEHVKELEMRCERKEAESGRESLRRIDEVSCMDMRSGVDEVCVEDCSESKAGVLVSRRNTGSTSVDDDMVVFSEGFIEELSVRGEAAGMKHRKEIFELQGVIEKYIRLKAEWYVESTVSDVNDGKKEEKKRLGRVSRLYMKEQIVEQAEYLKSPCLKPADAVAVYRLAAEYFKSKVAGKIGFPERNEENFLRIAIDKVKSNATAEEVDFFDSMLDSAEETVFKIKRALITQRSFKEVEVELRKHGKGAIECYEVSPGERLTDAFLCAYLFYEAERLGMFPDFIKPGDELDMKCLMDFCNEIGQIDAKGKIVVLYEGRYKEVMRKVDNNLLSKLLKLVIDPVLVDYMISRNNCRICYKDMSYTNHVGYISGFQFSAFVHKFYMFVIDLCVLGEDIVQPRRGMIKKYLRWMDEIYAILEMDEGDVSMLIDEYGEEAEIEVESMQKNYFDECKGIESKTNTAISGYVHAEMATRMHPSLGRIAFRRCSVFPVVRLSMLGVDVLISETRVDGKGSWKLSNGKYANLAVSEESVEDFEGGIRHLVGTSGSATFLKVAKRWNTLIIGFVMHFRECIYGRRGLEEKLMRAEEQIRNVVKRGMNSKMPVRFPAVMFYSPKEMGGLGMISAGGVATSCKEAPAAVIPGIMQYVKRWEDEFEESDAAWMEYASTGKIDASKGIPRMGTLLQKSKVLLYDRGFRMWNVFKRHFCTKPDWFWFTDARHDGRLWDIEKYPQDVLQAMGGVEEVMKHTLFGATHFRHFSKVFWEETVIDGNRRMTKAQKLGLNQVPNKRFMLWWSPTINRGDVYVGYQVQLEQTGIFMHGKLPTLKMSFVQIFRNGLWKRIHESIVCDVIDVFRKHCGAKRIQGHAKKSYRAGSSSADVLLEGEFCVLDALSISELMSERSTRPEELKNVDGLWIDVQLRWGDYERNDCHKYAKSRFVEGMNDPLAKYPGEYGMVAVVDLCYNTWSVYGHMNEELVIVLRSMFAVIIEKNSMLLVLRERIRKALQLYTSDVEVVHSSGDLFSSGMIVDSRYLGRKQRAVFAFDPGSGNLYFKSYCSNGKKIREAKQLAARDVVLLVHDLSKKSVSVTDDMIDVIENVIVDYPSVVVRSLRSGIPFSNVMMLGCADASDRMQSVKLYGGWNETSSFTNFCRLLLVMQALEIDDKKVVGTGINRMWPMLTDREWIECEVRLKDLIVERHCDMYGVDSKSLTAGEVRDIVFGIGVDGVNGGASTKVDMEAVRGVGLSASMKDSANGVIFFGEGNGWRRHYLRFEEEMKKRRDLNSGWKIGKTAEDASGNEGDEGCYSVDDERLSMNLIEEFAELMDPYVPMFALVVMIEGRVSFGLIPQFLSSDEICSVKYVPECIILGIVVNRRKKEEVERMVERYGIRDPLVIFVGAEVKVERWSQGEWKERRVKLVEQIGVFYAPEMWNYNFCRHLYDDGLKYEWRMRTPSEFYDGFSRAGHFCRFWKEPEAGADAEEGCN
ncbi:pre-mRNA-processing-splicing factor 8 [Ordospora pajunii]|uniref:pre-mRNA-processing-splicing factor 8 n=1 Tax=Ordospora pajunii TaxID=3039483 RepID=UPI00295268E4|nr:pre-mRNA-processing-splicing factor 8 [Ordospora pajunii]KAH9411623.1 pre-mRNA-processing-splicing factor 8 [Ordospora pajunii]